MWHYTGHGGCPPAGDDDCEADGDGRGENEIEHADLTSGEAADDSEHKQSQHVVDDGGGEDDLARHLVKKAAGCKHLRGDSDAGGHHGCADEYCFTMRRAPGDPDTPSE